jgi:6,7-dimethyl-8-ribityllumazine synthase
MPTVGLVIAQFYEELANEMKEHVRERTVERGADIIKEVPVPGVYDTPLAADRLARDPEIDTVTVLGAVVTGDTDHDQVIAHAIALQLSKVELDRDTPVTFGVMGPNMSYDEGKARTEKAARAVDAGLDLVEALPESH